MKLSFPAYAAAFLVGQGHAAQPPPRVHLDAAVEQRCGANDKCGNCKKTNCPDLDERKRCKRDHCSLEEMAALFPEDLISALESVQKVQKGSEVKQLGVGAGSSSSQSKKKGKTGPRGPKKKKGRSPVRPDGPADFSAVYTMTNQPDGNSILVYSRSMDDGALTFQTSVPTGGNGGSVINPGPPFPPLAAQDPLIVAGDCLLAANAGSGTVSSFFIEDEDTIDLVGTYPTEGLLPVSIAERDGYVYVLNAGGSGSIQGFKLSPDCLLSRFTAAISLEQGGVFPADPPGGSAAPSQVTFTPQGNLLVLIKAEGGGQNFELGVSGVASLNHYYIQPNGKPQPGSLTKTLIEDRLGLGLLTMDFDNENRLLVTESVNGEVSEWEVNDDFTYTQVNTVSVTQPVSGIRFNPGNKCVYTANAFSNSISALSAAPGSDHQLADSTAFSGIAGAHDLVHSADGENLYVLSGAGDPLGSGIYVFSTASDCGLAQLPTARGGFSDGGPGEGMAPPDALRLGEGVEALTPAGLAVFPASSGVGGSQGQEPSEGPLSDIRGTYAVVIREGTAEGYGNGVLYYDGHGHLSGDLTFNQPDDQTVFETRVFGTYDLEDDANGLRTQTLTYETTPKGPLTLSSRLSIQSFDFPRNEIATNVYGTQVVPSQFYPGGHVSYTMYQRPRPASGFKTSDLEGVWNVRGLSTGLNNDETGASGRINFLPDGTAEGFLVVDDPERISAPTPQFNGPPGPDGRVRATFPSPVLGEYTVFDDGSAFFEMNNQLLTFIMLDMPCVITELGPRRVPVTVECFTFMNSPATLLPLQFTWTRLDLE